MKQINKPRSFSEEIDNKKCSIIEYRSSIAKSLLEKYKPKDFQFAIKSLYAINNQVRVD